MLGSNDSIWMDMGFPERADAGYLNPSSFQITSAGEDEASSRLFVGNLTMNSEDSIQTGFGGGVIVASGDVNGDDGKADSLIGVSGRDWTLDSQPELTTEPTAPEAFKMQTVFTTHIALVDASSDVTGHTPEWTNFRSSDPGTPGPDDDVVGLPAVQDDGLLLPAVKAWDWEVKVDPSDPSVDLTLASGDGGFADGHNDDGGIIINFTPGPDDNVVELLGQPAIETLEIAHEGFLR